MLPEPDDHPSPTEQAVSQADPACDPGEQVLELRRESYAQLGEVIQQLQMVRAEVRKSRVRVSTIAMGVFFGLLLWAVVLGVFWFVLAGMFLGLSLR